MLACWLLECLLFIAVIVLPARFASLEIPLPPAIPQHDVIYFSGDELPQTQDRGGAESGKSGRAGGQQAHHRTQVIRVARGNKPAEKVVDAPGMKINLPHSDSAVANLLAFKPNPGPPPAEGLRSSLTAPALPEMSAVAPSPELASSASRKADSLTPSIIPPAADVSRTSTRTSPSLTAEIVAPAPNVSRDKMRAATSLAPNVVAPAPRETPQDLASARTPLTQTVDVVAPPVSAPPRDVSKPKLTLPAPAVVAPPPSQVSADLNSWGRTATGDLRSKPVPPPPSASGEASLNGRSSGFTAPAARVVPPPASIDGQTNGQGSGGRVSRDATPLVGQAEVVPPPPSLGGGTSLAGSGRGNKGNGTGSPLDLGSSVSPPKNAGGNAPGSAVVVSNSPGSKVGLPNSSAGALAMSPSGTAKTGLGGSGGGSSIGKGNGSGSGFEGTGSGAGKANAGAGLGSDPNARAGISPYPGSGGAGSGANGSPALPGVSVEGGTTTITLPSFGAPNGDAPSSGPGHSSANARGGPGYTIKATSSSGGVFNRYGQLKGVNYSIYLETSLGTAVMQYADSDSAAHPYSDLTAPVAIRDELPQGLHPTYVVFACILDRSGDLKDVRVLDPGAAETTSKLLVALRNWKFRPAFRGSDPVEVNAFLGFGIDTR